MVTIANSAGEGWINRRLLNFAVDIGAGIC